MTFNDLITLITETEELSDRFVLFVEDDSTRGMLIKAYMSKFIPTVKYKIIADLQEAYAFIQENYASITDYSLDYNITEMNNTEPLGHLLKKMGNTGKNVYIHSDDVNGQEILKNLLPYATIKGVPANIVDMAAI